MVLLNAFSSSTFDDFLERLPLFLARFHTIDLCRVGFENQIQFRWSGPIIVGGTLDVVVPQDIKMSKYKNLVSCHPETVRMLLIDNEIEEAWNYFSKSI